jgi:parallel beta-helix repeat protein
MRAPWWSAAISTLMAAALSLPPAVQTRNQPVRLTSGMVIDSSLRVQPGTYRLASASIERPAIVIRGDDVTVDLTGVTIEGGEPFADPDTYTGTGVLIDGVRGVTVRGGTIRGFKIAIRGRRAPALHLTGLDLSYNWKPRLRSGIEQENQADWLSFHNNERDEWLRYGAAVYISESDDAEIDHVRAVQGMNGLMATRSARLRIWNNTFSWLSGVGLGLYRTTDSHVMHNRIDWCVRGYSHGFYNRGQDSTGLLMYEQSSRNVVAYNSFTHGGDGVFLWAGQSTMDTGKGGANDNLFYDNDVSHAVANGIEATFSRNTIVRNRIDDSWHGIWGGYSYDTVIAENTFDGNDEAIAIEHGQDITIRDNVFRNGAIGIRLWANETQDPNWGYPKARDTRSRDYFLQDNRYENLKTGIHGTRTSGIRVGSESFSSVETPYAWGPGIPSLTIIDRLAGRPTQTPFPAPPSVAGGMDAKLPAGARRGRATIIVDEWGPYDYQSPKLWPVAAPGERPLRLRVLGPAGQWRVSRIAGGAASASSGVVPREIVITREHNNPNLHVELEYRGGRVVTPRGEVFPAGQPVAVSYSLFDAAIDWSLRFWKFDDGSDPLTAPAAFAARLKQPPARTLTLPRLAYANARAFGEGFTDRVAIVGTGSVTLPPGQYELVVTSDDGIRVWVDDRLVIEDWSIHGPKEDRVPIAGGAHRLRVEYFQRTGAAALQVQVVRR